MGSKNSDFYSGRFITNFLSCVQMLISMKYFVSIDEMSLKNCCVQPSGGGYLT